MYITPTKVINDTISILKNSFIPVILLIDLKTIPTAPNIDVEYAYAMYFFLQNKDNIDIINMNSIPEFSLNVTPSIDNITLPIAPANIPNTI